MYLCIFFDDAPQLLEAVYTGHVKHYKLEHVFLNGCIMMLYSSILCSLMHCITLTLHVHDLFNL